jgi:hypothetical protein
VEDLPPALPHGGREILGRYDPATWGQSIGAPAAIRCPDRPAQGFQRRRLRPWPALSHAGKMPKLGRSEKPKLRFEKIVLAGPIF